MGKTKSGLNYCSRLCKEKAQCKENTAWPSKAKQYRAKAGCCSSCGYNKVVGILQVHHKDRNDKNNVEENLAVLCPNCHAEEHFATSSGLYSVVGRAKRRLPRPTKEELAEMLSKYSQAEIGKLLGVSGTSISMWAKEYGLRDSLVP